MMERAVQTSDWDFPLAVGDQVRVTSRRVVNDYYGLDGIVESVEDHPTAHGPEIICHVVFPDGRRNTIARYALTFVSARAVTLP